MKSFLIIGMGRFGSHLCRNLAKLGNEVMIVDQNEELLEPLLPYVTDAKIGDCTKEEVLKSLGVGNFDKCFVCIGTNFQSSLEITCLLKELGAKYVISKATRDVHANSFCATVPTRSSTRIGILQKNVRCSTVPTVFSTILNWAKIFPSMSWLRCRSGLEKLLLRWIFVTNTTRILWRFRQQMGFRQCRRRIIGLRKRNICW